MSSTEITMAILTHPIQVMLAGVVLYYAGRAAVSTLGEWLGRRATPKPAAPRARIA